MRSTTTGVRGGALALFGTARPAARTGEGLVPTAGTRTVIQPPRLLASALVALVRDGGEVVSTTAFMATPGDDARGVSAATVFVLPNRDRLTELVSLVDGGTLQVEVTRRIPLAELPALHAEAAAGRLAGKAVVEPA